MEHDSTATNAKIVDSGDLHLTQPQEKPEQPDYEVISLVDDTPVDPSKTGPKNKKKLVAVEVLGYQVGRGLKRRIVNPDDVYGLAQLGCSDRDIAQWFDIDEQTLRYNFKEIMLKGRSELKQTLRQAMLKNALNGNAAVQIFLAKNLLGMSDNPVDSEATQPLPWTSHDD